MRIYLRKLLSQSRIVSSHIKIAVPYIIEIRHAAVVYYYIISVLSDVYDPLHSNYSIRTIVFPGPSEALSVLKDMPWLKFHRISYDNAVSLLNYIHFTLLQIYLLNYTTQNINYPPPAVMKKNCKSDIIDR